MPQADRPAEHDDLVLCRWESHECWAPASDRSPVFPDPPYAVKPAFVFGLSFLGADPFAVVAFSALLLVMPRVPIRTCRLWLALPPARKHRADRLPELPDAVHYRIMFIRSVLGHMPPEADLVALYVRSTDDDSVRLAVHPTPLLPLTHAKALVNLANRGLLDQDPYWAVPLLDRFLGP
jgi:hypothetical protein